MSENENYGQQWVPGAPNAPTQHVTGPQTGGPYPNYGPPTQGTGQPIPPGQTGMYGPPQAGPPQYAQPARPSFLALMPLPIKLAVGSGLMGLVTFFMGFLSWVTIGETIDSKAEDWAMDQGNSIGIPAFLTMVFTPGWFLLGLGAAAVAAFGFVAAKWRRFLPHVAFLVVVSWLGLLACALALPGFISLGTGAILALIFGSFQLLLIGAAVIMDGLNEEA
ncbi:DUF5336 domain-containing protein [Gordonia alkaliphila]|uniref:Uncharacterized protein n=1 Tax=Gordonia alkaliphila TaxID=1053547 RepID=A0ABP8YW45_9ACTN